MRAAQIAKPSLATTPNIFWERLRPTRLSSLTCPLVAGTDLGREVRPYVMTIRYPGESYSIYISEDGTLAQPCDPKFDSLAAVIPPTLTPFPTSTSAPLPPITPTPLLTFTPTITATPTITPSPIPTATPLPAAFTCPPDFAGFMPPRLVLGRATAGVGTGGSPNRLRDQPSVSGTQVGQIQPGRTISQVLGGPACTDTYVWWFVEMDGVEGWTVESDSSDGGTYFLEPLEGFPFPTAVPMVSLPPSPTAQSAVVLPTAAVTPGFKTVTYNRYSFTYSDALSSSTLESSMTLYTDDSQQDSPVTQIDLYDSSVLPEYRTWMSNVSLRFYNRADFTDRPYVKAIFDQLQTLLLVRPLLASSVSATGADPLPLLPRRDLSQAIRGRIRYVETPTVTGISYVTYLDRGFVPVETDGYLYTFQGLSKDGTTYISLIARLDTLAVPTGETNSDLTTVERYGDYIASALPLLEAATPDEFMPNLDDLDALVQTITVK